MSDYQDDREWSDRYIPTIKRIIAPHLMTVASFELDAKKATDLHVLNARNMMIAARIRDKGYAENFPYDFTIRSGRDTGTKTELAKIIDGWGDWFFYGHAIDDTNIGIWWLLDLNSFRAALIRRHELAIKFSKLSNGDGTHFVAYDVRSFPQSPPFIIASSGIPEKQIYLGDFA